MDIKDLEEISFLKISSWWGEGTEPGSKGFLITEDGQIIKFDGSWCPDAKTKQIKENVDVVCNLSPEEITILKKYLINDEKVFTTAYEEPMIMDGGTTIEIKIDGQTREINNESKMFYGGGEEKLYDRIINKIESLVSKTN